MRLKIKGIDRSGRSHNLLSMDVSYVTKVEIDIQCLDNEMRKDRFRSIIIEREGHTSKSEMSVPSPTETGKLHVSDTEHANIVEQYFAGDNGKGMGISKVSKSPKIKRSPSTVRHHLMRHDEGVKRNGFCPSCRRAKGRFHEIEVYKKTEVARRHSYG